MQRIYNEHKNFHFVPSEVFMLNGIHKYYIGRLAHAAKIYHTKECDRRKFQGKKHILNG